MKAVTRKVKRYKKTERRVPPPMFNGEAALYILAKLNGFGVGDLVELEDSDYSKLRAIEEMVVAARRVTSEFYEEPRIPESVRAEISTWQICSKSPYNDSFYNADGVTWWYKPEGSLRISDHWGWADKWEDGIRHCELADTPGYVTGWRMAEYRNGKYHTVKVF